MRIAVIAGHRTDKPGAESYLEPKPITEHNIVRDITLFLIEKLDEANIRWVSLNGTLKEKVQACNKLGVDLAIEIHLNSDASQLTSVGYGAECLLWGKAGYLSTRILSKLGDLGLKYRGVKQRKGLYFLRKTRMPAIIVECYFLDNEKEAEIYLHKTEEIATAIFDAVKEWSS